MKLVTLREMCAICGVSRRAVQGYEKAGLMKAAGKNERGYLLYGDIEIEKVRYIKMLQDFGLTLKEIVNLQSSDEKEISILLEEKRKRMLAQKEKLGRTIDVISEIIRKYKEDI